MTKEQIHRIAGDEEKRRKVTGLQKGDGQETNGLVSIIVRYVGLIPIAKEHHLYYPNPALWASEVRSHGQHNRQMNAVAGRSA